MFNDFKHLHAGTAPALCPSMKGTNNMNDKAEAMAQLAQFKYANQIGWSDITPYEIVKVVSDKCIEIRHMRTERDESVVLDFAVGGFAFHCSNQRDQKWLYYSEPTAPVVRIRKNKRGEWKIGKHTRFTLSDQPVKFYDYNF